MTHIPIIGSKVDWNDVPDLSEENLASFIAQMTAQMSTLPRESLQGPGSMTQIPLAFFLGLLKRLRVEAAPPLTMAEHLWSRRAATGYAKVHPMKDSPPKNISFNPNDRGCLGLLEEAWENAAAGRGLRVWIGCDYIQTEGWGYTIFGYDRHNPLMNLSFERRSEAVLAALEYEAASTASESVE